MKKPEVDFIEGLSPAIAIGAAAVPAAARAPSSPPPPRFTIISACYTRTSAKPHCPDTGVPIVSQTTSDIVDKILALPPNNPA